MSDRLFDPINNFPDVKPNEGTERNQTFEFYDSEGDSWKEYHNYSWIEVEEKLIDVFFQKPYRVFNASDLQVVRETIEHDLRTNVRDLNFMEKV